MYGIDAHLLSALALWRQLPIGAAHIFWFLTYVSYDPKHTWNCETITPWILMVLFHYSTIGNIYDNVCEVCLSKYYYCNTLLKLYYRSNLWHENGCTFIFNQILFKLIFKKNSMSSKMLHECIYHHLYPKWVFFQVVWCILWISSVESNVGHVLFIRCVELQRGHIVKFDVKWGLNVIVCRIVIDMLTV